MTEVKDLFSYLFIVMSGENLNDKFFDNIEPWAEFVRQATYIIGKVNCINNKAILKWENPIWCRFFCLNPLTLRGEK